jgi:capsular polysaccharide transport system ATP-binding protein
MIELINLTKYYPTQRGRHYVFRDLNFTFPDNVSIGLMGRNGAGKSTLMRMIGGIDTPDIGEVRNDKTVSWTVGSGSAFQGSLSARDNVRFVSRIYGASGDEVREKVRYVEEFAEIGKFFDLPMKTYSSGMKSRVNFGMSMAFKFDYYLIDEGMSAGDPLFRKKAQAVFKERIQESNVILVSHNVSDIREMCNVVVVVEGGAATLYENVDEGLEIYQGMQKVNKAKAP